MLKIIISTTILFISFVTVSVYINNAGVRSKLVNDDSEYNDHFTKNSSEN